MLRVAQKKKNHYWNNSGYAMIYTMVAIVVALVSLTLLGVSFRRNLSEASVQQMNAKAHYLARASSEMAVAALTQTKTDGTGKKLLEDITATGITDTIIHKDRGGNELGNSTLSAKRETISGADWIVVRITTTIPDYRTNIEGDDSESKFYTYKYRVHISVIDPSARLYYIE